MLVALAQDVGPGCREHQGLDAAAGAVNGRCAREYRVDRSLLRGAEFNPRDQRYRLVAEVPPGAGWRHRNGNQKAAEQGPEEQGAPATGPTEGMLVIHFGRLDHSRAAPPDCSHPDRPAVWVRFPAGARKVG